MIFKGAAPTPDGDCTSASISSNIEVVNAGTWTQVTHKSDIDGFNRVGIEIGITNAQLTVSSVLVDDASFKPTPPPRI